MKEEPAIETGEYELEIPPGSYLGNIRDDFNRLERSQEKANNFMMSLTGIIVGVFFVTGILIALDYFKYNEERYEKFIDEVKNTKNNFYTKDEAKSVINENSKNSQTLSCLKIKGYFSMQCFD